MDAQELPPFPAPSLVGLRLFERNTAIVTLDLGLDGRGILFNSHVLDEPHQSSLLAVFPITFVPEDAQDRLT